VAAARRALAAYADEPVHLIAGGSGKNEDFAPLAAALGGNVRSIHLIGDEAERLASALPGSHVDAELADAVAHAAELAEAGDVILLSPACASFDQFDNFEARGDAFRELVGALH
jgi:UDP-N-acetylmuramoylalanine--D-glutamate ligase